MSKFFKRIKWLWQRYISKSPTLGVKFKKGQYITNDEFIRSLMETSGWNFKISEKVNNPMIATMGNLDEYEGNESL